MKSISIFLFILGILFILVAIMCDKHHQFFMAALSIFVGISCWIHRNDDDDDEQSFRSHKTWES